MDFIIKAVILGIIEGVTEFLPISSTGHLILANHFIQFTGDLANLFDVVIQLGAILSVVIYFWRRLYPFSADKTPEEKTAASRDHGTIFAIGISRISSAPQALSCGISWFTIFFGTTVWML